MLTILATVLVIPIGYVSAGLIIDPVPMSEETDGLNGFTTLDGADGIVSFTNSSTSKSYALVTGFDDDAITVLDLTNPSSIGATQTQTDDPNVGRSKMLNGPSNVVTFENDTTSTFHQYALVVSHIDDGIQIFDIRDPESGLYPSGNFSAAGDLVGGPRVALDGAFDAATWHNTTTGEREGHYAIVTAFLDDAVTTFDLGAPEVGNKIFFVMNVTDGENSKHWDQFGRLVMDGPLGVDTFVDGTRTYAIVAANIDDGVQVFDVTDSTGFFPAGTTAGDGAANTGNATKAATGFELLDGAFDVATFKHGGDNYAIVTSDETDSVTVINLADPATLLVTDTMTDGDGAFLELDGANDVIVTTLFERNYAIVSSNATGASGIQVIDLYDPTNIQPISSVRADSTGSNGELFTELDGANGSAVFTLSEHTYVIVASKVDDGVQIIKLTAQEPSSNNNKVCGISMDCTAPSINRDSSGAADGGFTINNTPLASQDRFNDVDTVESKVGQLVTIKASIYDAYGADQISKANLYFDMPDAVDWSDAAASIRYDILRDEVEINDVNDIFSADVTSQEVGGKIEVSFKIMFTAEMDTSHIAIQTLDNARNYQLIYFKDALEVTGTPTQTSADATLDDEITQVSATVPGWVKNTAGWWADGAISEGEFVRGIEFLIQEQIIDTDAQTSSSEGTGTSVPDWVKNTAGWWADGAISEGEFVNAIEHLVKTGTIIII